MGRRRLLRRDDQGTGHEPPARGRLPAGRRADAATRHAPSIAAAVRETLADRGYGDDDIEALLDDATATELAREYAIAPPAITTEGARTILKRLCESADVTVDGDYLKPGGARQAGGEEVDRTAATGPQGGIRTSFLEQSLASVVVTLRRLPDRTRLDPATGSPRVGHARNREPCRPPGQSRWRP